MATTSMTAETTDTLAALRALAEPGLSARIATERQAAHLLKLLQAMSATSVPDRLIELIPNLDITYANDFSGHGFSFWDDEAGNWCIYVRSRDAGYDQVFTLLREIKHIVDEPLRAASADPKHPRWTVLPNYFAEQVIAEL
jgi:hypothetical protein